MQIQEKPPYNTLFECIGGEDKLKALIERFYDLMDLEPAYARLREVHGESLDQARQRTFWFLCVFCKCSWWFFLCYFDFYVRIVFQSHLTFNNWFYQRNWILS